MKKKLGVLFLVALCTIAMAACGSSKTSDETKTISTVEDLEGAKIGVQLGTTGDLYSSDYEGDEAGTTVERYNKMADAIQALKQEADYISAGVVNLCNIIEPEAIVLAGDITYRAGLLIALISESCSVRHILRNVYNPQILVSEQTDSINISSAAAIVIEEFYLGNIMFF